MCPMLITALLITALDKKDLQTTTNQEFQKICENAKGSQYELKKGMCLLFPSGNFHAAYDVKRCVSVNLTLCCLEDVPKMLAATTRCAAEFDVMKVAQFAIGFQIVKIEYIDF